MRKYSYYFSSHRDGLADSTLEFLSSEWSDKLPPGYKVRTAEINHPREEDPCLCEFDFERVDDAFEDTEVSMSYQWFVGGKIPMDFVPIEGAVGEVDSHSTPILALPDPIFKQSREKTRIERTIQGKKKKIPPKQLRN